MRNRRFWNFYNSVFFFFFSLKAWRVKYLRHLLINHPNYSNESSYGIHYPSTSVVKNVIEPPGELREHHLYKGKVEIQIKCHIILFDSFFFFGSGFHNPNYLKIKTDLILDSNVPRYLNLNLSNLLKYLFFYFCSFIIKLKFLCTGLSLKSTEQNCDSSKVGD